MKLKLSTRGDRQLLATDQRLREADNTVSELQRWYPQLQVLVEENEKAWATLAHNLRKTSRVAQQTYPAEHGLHYVLDHLHEAGTEIKAPKRGHTLYEERARVAAELRALNDRIRELRMLQMGCVAAVKEKEYYLVKVESLRVNEGRKKKVTERDVDKRLRNEQKLAEVVSDLSWKWERLMSMLERVQGEKGEIVERVMWAFVRTQRYYFDLDPMGVVLTLMRERRSDPKQIENRSIATECSGFEDVGAQIVMEKGLPVSPSPLSDQRQDDCDSLVGDVITKMRGKARKL